MSGGNICWLAIFIHFIICLSILCSNTGAFMKRSNDTDRLALLAFKAKITDDPFEIMNLWNDSTHFCHWYGVTCSTRHRQRVTILSLQSLKLGGSISPHVGNLSFLRIMELTDNNFIHQIPQEIGRLRRLQALELSNNTLSGKIPLNLSSCSKLTFLKLTNNKLEGHIPFELGSLSKMQFFLVGMNNLSGTLPPSLGNWTFLENFFVEENSLVGRIPDFLGNLNHLINVAFGANYFFGEMPSSVFNLSYVKSIDFAFNQLGGHLPPNLFNTLPNLLWLSFISNEFTGPIPASLSNATHLQALQLEENKFTGDVPTSLGSLNMVRIFSVSENQLGSGYGAQDDLSFLCALTNSTTLTDLQIFTNSFGGMLPDCISNISSTLAFLSVSNNYISGSIPTSIGNLVGLKGLDLSRNSFTGTIPLAIGNLKYLAKLYLYENNLSGWIPTSLGNLSNLIHLLLSSNSLEGSIPSSLQNCTSLEMLHLDQNNLIGFIPPQVLANPSLTIGLSFSGNQLTGPLPEEAGMLTNLNLFDVSNNMLSGKIPDSLGKCTSMELLSLGRNNFQGPIPSSLSSMKGLQVLDLSSNNLSGQIPDLLASLNGLTTLNLSFNNLDGPVPEKGVFTNSSATLLKGNNKLCGGISEFHLPACSKFPERKKRKLSNKIKVIIASIGGFAGVVLILLLILFVFGSRRKQRQSREEHAITLSKNPALEFVSYGDLHKATNGFSEGNLLGAGSFGHVYKGILGEGGQIIAVKVLDLKKMGANRSFVAECEALRNIRHKNLVKLFTVCSGTDYQGHEFKALVYEFMSKGSLEDWLHPPAIREDEIVHHQIPARKLGLLRRLGIAIDVASSLEYVHHHFGTPLVHCDIKPSNILLDDDLSGHVSDFGLSKFLSESGFIQCSVHPSSSIQVRGTVGYAPPEYGVGSEVSTQGDVYSYGILLLEMFTGKKPTDEMFKEDLCLHLYAKMALQSGVVDTLRPILEDLLEADEHVFNPRRSSRGLNCLMSVIEVGVSCSLESPSDRMVMSMVTTKLIQIRDNLLRGMN